MLQVGDATSSSAGVVRATLTEVGVEESLCDRVDDVIKRRFADPDETSEVLSEALGALTSGLNDVFEERISPVIFYIGSTGLLPDHLQSEAHNADSIRAHYPELSMGQTEERAMFLTLMARAHHGVSR